MLVSIVIPAFNSAQYLGAAIRSALSQTYSPVEVIVVDDGSNDETAQVAGSFGSRIKFIRQRHQGGPAARNLGARTASGELVAYCDADDVMTPRRIETQVAAYRSEPHIGLIVSDYVNFDEKGLSPLSHFQTCVQLGRMFARNGAGDRVVLDPDEATGLLIVEQFACGALTVPRWALRVVGMWDETLGASQDFDLEYRLASCYRVAILNQIGLYRRQHEGQISRNIVQSRLNAIVTRSRILKTEWRADRRAKLTHAIGGFQLDVSYALTGQNNSLAAGQAVQSLRNGHLMALRQLGRILLDILGVDVRRAAEAAPVETAPSSRNETSMQVLSLGHARPSGFAVEASRIWESRAS